MVFNYFLLLVNINSVLSEVRLNMTYDPFLLLTRFPVSFEVFNSTETPVHGYATFDLVSNESRLTCHGMPPESFFQHHDQVQAVIFGDNNSSISVPVRRLHMFRPTCADEWNRIRVSISANYQSSFFATVNDFIMTPTSASTGQLILNPNNVNDHALDGQWFYTRSVSDEFPQVQVAVSVGENAPRTPPAPFRIDMMSDTHILPQEAMEQFVDALNSLGVYLSIVGDDHRRVHYHMRSDLSGMVISSGGYNQILIRRSPALTELLPSFPRINFEIQLDNSQLVHLSLISDDYMQFDGFNGDQLRVLFAANANHPLTIGHNLISKIAIHVDPRNHRIGFAEPLAEI